MAGGLGDNPVDAVIAWDTLGSVEGTDPYEDAGGDLFDVLGGEIAPDDGVEPRGPAMGQSADYFLAPAPKATPPDPGTKLRGFEAWREAGVPTYELVVRGGTHYEWSRIQTFPATSWTFGNALADHYSLAWLGRWLERPDETGYHTADERLLADRDWADHLSFYYRSARDFPTRTGDRRAEDDIRAATLESDPATLADTGGTGPLDGALLGD